MTTLTPRQRAARMRRLRYKHKWTYQRIGDHYGISRQRVHEIVKGKP